MNRLPQEVLRAVGVAVAPRVLGLGDRNPESATCGCYDRAYWKYLLSDFPSGWFQAAVWYLSELYVMEAEGPFAGNPLVRTWALEAMEYTISITHPDGSIDEVYPYERSYCTTAFCLAWLTQGLLLINALPLQGVEKMARWLVSQPLPEASNQGGAAVLGLAGLWRLTGDVTWKEAAEHIGRKLLDKVSCDYFPEYGGLDIGYLTLTVGLLARAASLGVTIEGLKEALARAGGVIESCVGDHGIIAPHARWRGTQYLYPTGLIGFAPGALQRLMEGLETGVAVEPSWLDDRYFIPLAADYLAAARIMQGG